MLTRLTVQGSVLLLAVSVAGCQSWSPGAFPLQNMSRVPPPGTGTYQLPSGYYNNSSAMNSSGSSQVMTASTAENHPQPVGGGLPSTSPATGFQPFHGATQQLTASPSSPPVTSAQFTQPAPSGREATEFQAGQFTTQEIGSTQPASFSDDSQQAAAPALQWQP